MFPKRLHVAAVIDLRIIAMNTKHTNNLIGFAGQVGAWLLGALMVGLGWLVQFLDRPAPRVIAQPVRVCHRSRPTGYATGKRRETGRSRQH